MNGSSDSEFTKIPNSILDNMDKMNESELRVALAIARKTLGWQKPEDRMSYSQFETMTGLSRTAVRDGINAAIEHHVVRRDSVGAQTYRYSLPVGLSYQFDDATSSTSLPEPVAPPYQYDDPTSSNILPEPVGLSYQLGQKPVGLSYSQKNRIKETEERTDVAHAHEENGGGGGGLVDRLIGFSFTDQQITEAVTALGSKLDDALLDRWQAVINDPPRGLNNPTAAMVSRLTRGNITVPLLGSKPASKNGRLAQTPAPSEEQRADWERQKQEGIARLASAPPRMKL